MAAGGRAIGADADVATRGRPLRGTAAGGDEE